MAAHLAWQTPRGRVNIEQAPQGAGDHGVLAEQFLVNQSTKCDLAKGVVSVDPVLAKHCLTMLEPGSMLIVHPGAESKLRGLVREETVEQLSLFLGV
jgi:hypothetical protein